MLAHLRDVHTNGGALLASFDVENDNASDWGPWLDQLVGRFLSSPELRSALPELFDDPPYLETPSLKPASYGALLVEGFLTGKLMVGGAYTRFRGTTQEARDVAAAAVEEVVQGRYFDFWVYYTWQPWTPWFLSVAWDLTGVAVDTKNKRLTLLVLTDTD